MAEAFFEDTVNGLYYGFTIGLSKINWDLDLNIISQTTIAGRVEQVLLKDIKNFSVTGNTGKRGVDALFELADFVERHQKAAKKTGRPLRFVVPSRSLDFNVFIESFPKVGLDAEKTNYEFTISLSVVANNLDPEMIYLSEITNELVPGDIAAKIRKNHTVAAGETWETIAESEYGDKAYAQYLKQLNGVMEPGVGLAAMPDVGSVVIIFTFQEIEEFKTDGTLPENP